MGLGRPPGGACFGREGRAEISGRLADPAWGGPWEAREGGPALCLLAGTEGRGQGRGNLAQTMRFAPSGHVEGIRCGLHLFLVLGQLPQRPEEGGGRGHFTRNWHLYFYKMRK